MNYFWSQVWALARRSIVRPARQPAAVVFPLIFPMLLLLVNSGGLKASTKLPGFPISAYDQLSVPQINNRLRELSPEDLEKGRVSTEGSCPKCKTANKVRVPYCTKCAAALNDVVMMCHSCGKDNRMGSRFCIHCGNRLR